MQYKKNENFELPIDQSLIKNNSISIFEKCILFYPELKNLKKYYYDKHKEYVKKDSFFEYIQKGDIESLYCCIQAYKIDLKKFYVTKSRFEKENALMYACFVNQLQIVKLLVETFEMNLELVNSKNCTALIYACFYHSIDIVEYLIERGANVKHIDKHEKTCYDYLDYNEKQRITEFIKIKNLNVNKPIMRYQ